MAVPVVHRTRITSVPRMVWGRLTETLAAPRIPTTSLPALTGTHRAAAGHKAGNPPAVVERTAVNRVEAVALTVDSQALEAVVLMVANPLAAEAHMEANPVQVVEVLTVVNQVPVVEALTADSQAAAEEHMADSRELAVEVLTGGNPEGAAHTVVNRVQAEEALMAGSRELVAAALTAIDVAVSRDVGNVSSFATSDHAVQHVQHPLRRIRT
jgi:hypothetical protein